MANRVAVVTGAGGGIGGACARVLAHAHDVVLCVDRSVDSATATVDAIEGAGGSAIAVEADASDREFGERISEVARLHGVVGSAVHALAHEEHTAAVDLSIESLWTSLQVGPVAAFSLFRSLVARDVVEPGAAFTVIGSLHETHPFRNCLGYNAAHGALGQVVRTLAHEWAPRRLRVNAVVPGWIATPGERRLYSDDHLRRAGEQLPFGRLGTVEQVADAVAFLSSAAASYISGSFLTVDGALATSLARLPGEDH